MSQDHLEATEKSLAVVRAISDNLPRLDIYEQLHDDPRFRIALVDVFTDVVEYAVRAYEYFRHRAPRTSEDLIRDRWLTYDQYGWRILLDRHFKMNSVPWCLALSPGPELLTVSLRHCHKFALLNSLKVRYIRATLTS